MNVLIVNGPNLNMLGEREPELYGKETYTEILKGLQQAYMKVNISYYQSNHEGELIDKLQQWRPYDGIIINAGGYSHTSIALQDTLRMVGCPKVEVHLSNVYKREPYRHISYLAPAVDAVISGMGKWGYYAAIDWLWHRNHDE